MTVAEARLAMEDLEQIVKNIIEGHTAETPVGREIIAMYQALRRKFHEVDARTKQDRGTGPLLPPGAVKFPPVAPATTAEAPRLAGLAPLKEALGPGRGSADAVKRLQRVLMALGYTLRENGLYDNATATAVRAFQGANALPTDGVVGAATRKALNDLIRPGA
jgi:murein L,D-transpeptidase YcbB/YkuD